MGKKKDKRNRHAHRDEHAGIPPQVAGLAAAALKQVNTPAFQHLIAGALGAAGQAMEQMAQRSAGGSAPSRPTPPEPPVPPEPQAACRPGFATSPIQLTPETTEAIERVAHQAAQAIEGAAAAASRAIETAAAAFERWAEKQAPHKREE